MHLIIDGREHSLEVFSEQQANLERKLSCRFDESAFEAEVVEIDEGVYSLLLDGKSYPVRVAPRPEPVGGTEGPSYQVQVDGTNYQIELDDPRRWKRNRGTLARTGQQRVTAPMPGKVVRLLVAKGDPVETGQGLVVVEAMKMQNELRCHGTGRVTKVLVKEGQAVTAGEPLLVIE